MALKSIKLTKIMKKLLLVLTVGAFMASCGGSEDACSCKKMAEDMAKETTAAGIVISYSNVNKTDKGAYTLEGSSQQGRAWFIGAQSYLLLDTQMIPYKCR